MSSRVAAFDRAGEETGVVRQALHIRIGRDDRDHEPLRIGMGEGRKRQRLGRRGQSGNGAARGINPRPGHRGLQQCPERQ